MLPWSEAIYHIGCTPGIWRIELDEKSLLLTTFNRPFGRYCWKRMPFRISSAHEVFQCRMYELVDLEGVEVVTD